MTQIPRLGAPVTNIGAPNFELAIYDPTGINLQRILSAHDINQAGVIDGITSTIQQGACKGLIFSGRPDLVRATGGEIVKFRFSDGGDWKDGGYGTVLEGWPVREATEARQYVVDADELLRHSIVDDRVYGPSEPANIAANLANDLRHPALKYRPSDFPPTGTTLAGDFNLPGATFLDAFAKLAEAAETAGVSVTYGVDPSGYIFFKPVSNVAEVPYLEEEYEHLKIDARGLVTQVHWIVGNKPSQDGYSGEYNPGTLTHVSTPNPALHSFLRRPVARQPTDTGSLFVPIAATSIEQFGFATPEFGWDSNLNGSRKLGGVAERTATTGAPYFQINIIEPNGALTRNIYGATIRYRCDYGVSAPRIRLWFVAERVDVPGTRTALTAEYALPYSNEQYSEQTYILPPPSGLFRREDGSVWRPIANNAIYTARVSNLGHAGVFAISDFRFMRLNTAALNSAARREIKYPAIEPAQIIPRRFTPEGRQGYWVPHDLTRIVLTGTPWGDLEAPVAELRYTFNEIEGFQSVVDLGNPARTDEGETVEAIRLGVERLNAQQEIQIGRRL